MKCSDASGKEAVMANKNFEAFEASFIDALFDLTSDERWPEEAKHFSERHLISEKEAQTYARFNPSQMHSVFAEGWDSEKIKDELVLEVMDREYFLKNIIDSTKDKYYGVIIPAKGCGTSITCVRDESNKVIGFTKAVCNMAVVVFDIKLSRAEGFETIYSMSLKTVYPANEILIRRERTGLSVRKTR